ncbi:MAG: cation diffusion facilitator family transporter [Rhodospirillum sp.]|nr:cation diffusion facilitator family transporter [Rhodospirillum sp.]MCF8491600.1 cation diffusion facilitator family transporter [Rhodospirillum sp.]MCF8499509.1 cation diffusion facilitator family transporter [Rhodospirillum sp.]
MALALTLTGGFMVAELIGGWLTGSLALMADAAHMLSDTGALALALGAMTLARRPANDQRTYGLHRMEVLAAFINGLVLLGLAIWIVVEAIPRITSPVPVIAGPMMFIAVLGLVVNIAVYRILSGSAGDADTPVLAHAQGHGGHGHGGHGHGGHGHGAHGVGKDLNTRAALAHVMGDLLGSVAAILAAGIILTTGWTVADPLLSILVSALVARSALAIIRESAHVLVEGTPPGLDVRSLSEDMERTVEGKAAVHHLHAWSLTPDHPMVTFHVVVGHEVDPEATLASLKHRLEVRWAIRHSVIQVECGPCPDVGHGSSSASSYPSHPGLKTEPEPTP